MRDTATGLAGHAANQGENRLGSHCRDWRNAGFVAKTKTEDKVLYNRKSGWGFVCICGSTVLSGKYEREMRLPGILASFVNL